MATSSRLKVKQGYSSSKDPTRAVAELKSQLDQPALSGVVFFCSSKYDLAALGGELKQAFACPLIGCTTAGEICAQAGYIQGGIVGASLSSAELRLHTWTLSPLSSFGMQEAQAIADSMQQCLELHEQLGPEGLFSLLLVDGTSMKEEQVVSALYGATGGVPLIGGSAGDDLAFEQSWIYHDGKFLADAAMLVLFETTLPFRLFKTQHFEPTDERLVITKADPPKRIVHEINGGPAAREYAAAIGVDVDQLTPQVFSTHPLMLRIGGEYYVRSIQKANMDGSLSFYCAIDNGLVLRIGEGVGLVEGLHSLLGGLSEDIPHIELILGCDCILRRLEIEEKGLTDEVNKLLAGTKFIGFSTYGEQFSSIHINQTLTGVVIGG
jgi:hypothetical protein